MKGGTGWENGEMSVKLKEGTGWEKGECEGRDRMREGGK